MRHLLAALLTVAFIPGCGGQELTGDERLAVAEANYAFARVALDGSTYGEALNGVDNVIALYRQKPDAKYDGLTMRQIVENAASNLDNYQPDMAAELDRALE